MKEKNVSSYAEITEAAAVKVLMDRNQVQLLRPFFAEAVTLTQAATQLELPLQFLLRKVQRFVKLGLLNIVKEEARKGRSVKYYQTPAALLYVPASYVDIGALLRRSENFWHGKLVDGLLNVWQTRGQEGLGIQIHPNDIGGVRISMATQPGEMFHAANTQDQNVLNSWLRLHLTAEDAAALKKDMTALIESYSAKHIAGAKATYIARLALAPLSD